MPRIKSWPKEMQPTTIFSGSQKVVEKFREVSTFQNTEKVRDRGFNISKTEIVIDKRFQYAKDWESER